MRLFLDTSVLLAASELTGGIRSVKVISMKEATAGSRSKEDSKHATLVAEGLRELKGIQQEIRRSRSSSERLRVSSARLTKETRAILRRVEATL